IESATLERRMLLLGDLPGLTVTPVMRPSGEVGQGNLEARVSESEPLMLKTGADNHGSHYSGEYRGRVNVAGRHRLKVGDELSLIALYSNENTWLGDLRYSLPLGVSGLRGELGYAHTDYSLGRGFDGYAGTAEVYSAQLSYPLLRRQQANVTVFARYRYKNLDDTVDFADYRKATESHGLPFGIQFDARDSVGQGGLTYGRLAVTPGTLKQSQRQSWIGLSDADYGFTKVNMDIVRHQTLDKRFSLYSRIDAQWADRRYLDGSESFSLGGPHGVRAFPISEGLDSRGWLAQLELRYRNEHGLAPYLFYDMGRTPNGGIDGGEPRRLAGVGLGLRYQRRGFNLDLASAWEVRGGDALSDDRQRDPRVWATVTFRF
ncbi:MAG TPA: ShlB/FhaC/HecB family hemolysin secretion/activation protein, partial [Wenzhouxiangella sp.]|nr:ShlB/FhaC/HecB family hemolysin secretion/activation protein [Wenzhouxiangella sp.]